MWPHEPTVKSTHNQSKQRTPHFFWGFFCDIAANPTWITRKFEKYCIRKMKGEWKYEEFQFFVFYSFIFFFAFTLTPSMQFSLTTVCVFTNIMNAYPFAQKLPIADRCIVCNCSFSCASISILSMTLHGLLIIAVLDYSLVFVFFFGII